MTAVFKFTEDGELIPVDDVKSLTDDDTAIIVDDLGNKVVLLLGENVGGLMRAKAMRAARNLRLRFGRRHELIEVDPSQRGEWLSSIVDSLTSGRPIAVVETVPPPTVPSPSSEMIEETSPVESVPEESFQPEPETTVVEPEPMPSPEGIVIREPLKLKEIDPDDLDYLVAFFGAYLLGLPVTKIKKVITFQMDPRLRSHVLDYIRERAVKFFDSFVG